MYACRKGFETVERYTGLNELVLPKGSVVLLECMSNLVANEMFREDGFHPEVAGEITDGVKNILPRQNMWLIVTNEIFSDGILTRENQKNIKNSLDRSIAIWQRWRTVLWKLFTEFLSGTKEVRKREKCVEQLQSCICHVFQGSYADGRLE